MLHELTPELINAKLDLLGIQLVLVAEAATRRTHFEDVEGNWVGPEFSRWALQDMSIHGWIEIAHNLKNA